MRNSIFASVLFTSFLFACGGEDGTTPVTTDDTGTAAADTGTSSTDDTGTSTTDTATADDTGMTTMETGGDTMMATDTPAADAKMDTPAMGATFTQVYAIIKAKCGTCHTGGSPSGSLGMATQADAYKNLVGVKAAAGGACSGGMTRVVKGNAANSLLVDKVEPSPTCGSRMPRGGAPFLSDTEIATIRNWINAGANND